MMDHSLLAELLVAGYSVLDVVMFSLRKLAGVISDITLDIIFELVYEVISYMK